MKMRIFRTYYTYDINIVQSIGLICLFSFFPSSSYKDNIWVGEEEEEDDDDDMRILCTYVMIPRI